MWQCVFFFLVNHFIFFVIFSAQASTAPSYYLFPRLKHILGLVQWCISPINHSISQFHRNEKVVKACLGFISSLTEMQNSKGDLWQHLSESCYSYQNTASYSSVRQEKFAKAKQTTLNLRLCCYFYSSKYNVFTLLCLLSGDCQKCSFYILIPGLLRFRCHD